MKISKTILAWSLLLLFSSFAENDKINTSYHLFKIERSKDSNKIFYDLNLTCQNKIDTDNPIKIYWIRNEDPLKSEPLTWIQKKYAYGIKYLNTEDTFAEFQFVSYKKRNFQLKKDTGGVFKVFTKFENKEVIVNRIFIQIDGGTFWVPKISKVELHFEDTSTKEQKVEVFIP